MKSITKILLSLLITTFAVATVAERDDQPGWSFTQAELDQMLAPIALYPDTVLSHILIASTYPLEVVQADRWASSHKDLSGEAALRAVENESWDPSVKALVPFPNVLRQMNEDLDWTQRLGEAFLQDEERVLDTVQNLRQRAYKKGSLDSLEHIEVDRDGDNIVIEPTVREVVYVPYYDTRVVYGPWWWDNYPPIYWPYRGYHYTSGIFVWGPSVHIGTSIYFSSFHWHRRHVVIVDHHHHHYFRSSRHVAHYRDARRWHHNPVHRRGVIYRSLEARERYGDSRRYSVDVNRERRGAISRSLSERHRDDGHRASSNIETHPRREGVLRELRERNPERVERSGSSRPEASNSDNDRRSVDLESRRSGVIGDAVRNREGVVQNRQPAVQNRQPAIQNRQPTIQNRVEQKRAETRSQPQTYDRSDREHRSRGAIGEATRERRQSPQRFEAPRSSNREHRSTMQRPDRSGGGGAINRAIRER